MKDEIKNGNLVSEFVIAFSCPHCHAAIAERINDQKGRVNFNDGKRYCWQCGEKYRLIIAIQDDWQDEDA